MISKMSSFYAHITCFFSFFALFPFVFSQPLSNQTNTMINLSERINSTAINWDITQDPCSWRGVECSPNMSVTNVSLSGYSISTSDWLPVVCNLGSLQFLDVSNNHLSSIPDEFIRSCGGIEGLKLLNFSKNRLVGSLPTFNGFVGLEFLDFSYNLLSGNIGFQLDGLVGLRSLNLNNNHFNGSLPIHLGKSMVLEQLELSMNRFQGGIPEEILGYKNLALIDLSDNRISGPVPPRIGELSRLEVLVLSSNDLTGEIPISLVNITTLWRFAAYENNFGGNIHSGITRYLRILDLSYNNLVGSIPSDFLSRSNLQTVDLSSNRLTGPVPSDISPSLVRLRLGNNSLSGEIPSASLGSLEKLTYLELDNNFLSGFIPPQLGSCRSLALLNLAQNNLTGDLPVQLGGLRNLQVMRLQLNKLVGEIPVEITQLSRLSILNISWNSLSGSIPSNISSLQLLTNLHLQANNLNGSIPSTFGSLNSLIELQLGQNQLSGEIPILPPNLQIALNLSYNLFEGPIPKNLDRLTGLEVLDLSNNKFSGEIPDYLTTMNTLTHLLLANNQLTGVIPKFKAWVEVDTNGNKNLVNATAAEMPKKRKSVTVGIILGAVAAVLVVGAVAIIALSISRRFYRVDDEQLETGVELSFPQVVEGNLLTANGIHRSNIDFSKAMEAVTDPSKITLKTKFSTYYEVIMPSGASYLVKKLNWSDKIFQLGRHDKFGQELEFLGKLSNSNVMTPLAYVLTVDSAYLFYEFLQKGTLFDALHGSLGNSLDWASRYSIAIGVAQGLSFLHGCNSGPILLLDLSTKSILLKSLKEPQIGDIELCKVIDPSKSTGSLSAVAGSVGYIPPEYAYTMRVTMAGNVYSFGVILLELLTGKPAVSEGTELAKRVSSYSMKQNKWDHILDITVSRTSPAFRSQMLAVMKVALACVSLSPEARPKMKSVLRMLLNAR